MSDARLLLNSQAIVQSQLQKILIKSIDITITQEEDTGNFSFLVGINSASGLQKLKGNIPFDASVLEAIGTWLKPLLDGDQKSELTLEMKLKSVVQEPTSRYTCLPSQVLELLHFDITPFLKKANNEFQPFIISKSIDSFEDDFKKNNWSLVSFEAFQATLQNLSNSKKFSKYIKIWEGTGVIYIKSLVERNPDKVCLFYEFDENIKLSKFSIFYRQYSFELNLSDFYHKMRVILENNFTQESLLKISEELSVEIKALTSTLKNFSIEAMQVLINKFNEKWKDMALMTCTFNRETGEYVLNIEAAKGLIHRSFSINTLSSASPNLFSGSKKAGSSNLLSTNPDLAPSSRTGMSFNRKLTPNLLN